ncbi:hypothetical protein BGZ70_002044 [Mortierella alpina]|uniref:F-box domain-containing protein n=1 Tax=Mortierella alpina TaxID=64518 RepID=A0A9P6IVE8_MORAP|nr:hypothetical protein BGZ70_002044 [Mortierella alpina]
MASTSSDLSNGSCSTSTSDVVGLLHRDAEEGPILIRLLSHRDVFPMILGYLDIRSLLALSSLTTRFRREILMPATPNLCCIHIFLQHRTVICPMSQFESLKDFMAKYRSFKPLHLHFTYSARSSLMSLVPEVSAPIYNSKVDTTFAHPSSSPLTTSHLFGVNQSISINITSTNSLYQYHHPLQQDQQQPQQQSHRQLQLIHTQHENDQPETASSSHSSSLTSTSTLTGSSISTKADSSAAAQQTAGTDTRFNATRTSSSSSTTTTDSDSFESLAELGRRGTAASAATTMERSGKLSDLETKTAAMSIDRPGPVFGTSSGFSSGSGSSDIPSTTAALTSAAHTITAAKSISDVAASVQFQQQQLQQQLNNSRFVNYSSNGHHTAGSTSSSSSSSNHTPNHTHRGGLLDLHSSILSDSIPVLSSSTSSITPPVSGHHGFELSYWQKFALNELFMRLLPFLKTLTIGRTDKSTRRDRDEDPNKMSGELSAGVCFFLARCFNVMHDMPDTALEAVLWMDVTPKDVVLLTTMIELRDIMVDERYWKRGYWAVDRPGTYSNGGRHGDGAGYYGDEEEEEDAYEDEDEDEDEGDWDGFYYLLNQEGSERRPSQQPKKKSSLPFMNAPSVGGKSTLRKSNTVKASSSSSSSSAASSPASSPFSKQTTAPLSSQQQVSGLGHLVKNASSSSSAPVTTASSPSRGHNGTIKKGARSVVQSPAAWQGFGEGVLDTSSSHSVNNTLYAEGDALPPAVQLFEVLKQEINEVGSVPRFISKSRLAFTTSDPWPSTIAPREA